MGSHPANLILRFLLEIIALISLGIWGWNQSESWFRFVLAIGIPGIIAVIWGTFAVPNDPSRSGSAPVTT
ncbi:MAG: YrdB family protein, partial [Robiginitalea sp.]